MEGQPPDNVFNKKAEDTAAKVQEELPQPDPITHRYRRYDQSSTVVCDDCGGIIFDTGRHDQFHLLVEQP